MKLKLLILILLASVGVQAQFTNYSTGQWQRQIVGTDTTFKLLPSSVTQPPLYVKSINSIRNGFVPYTGATTNLNLGSRNAIGAYWTSVNTVSSNNFAEYGVNGIFYQLNPGDGYNLNFPDAGGTFATREYVSGMFSPILTFNNGLTLASSTVKLGGVLNQEITEIGSSINSPVLGLYNYASQKAAIIGSYMGTKNAAIATGVTPSGSSLGLSVFNGLSENSIRISETNISIKDEINSKGLYYSDSYYKNWTNSDSLVLTNKKYVDTNFLKKTNANLQTITSNGNSTTIAIQSKNKIFAGDSIANNRIMTFIGTSFTGGIATAKYLQYENDSLFYSYKVANRMGFVANRRGLAGRRLQSITGVDSSIYNVRYSIPQYKSGNFLVIELPVNDITQDTILLTQALYRVQLDSVVKVVKLKGYTASTSLFYNPSYYFTTSKNNHGNIEYRHSTYAAITDSICNANGLVFKDDWTSYKAAYMADNSIIQFDDLHPSVPKGQRIIAESLYNYLKNVITPIDFNLTKSIVLGSHRAYGNSKVGGNSTTEYLKVNRQATISGDAVLKGGIILRNGTIKNSVLGANVNDTITTANTTKQFALEFATYKGEGRDTSNVSTFVRYISDVNGNHLHFGGNVSSTTNTPAQDVNFFASQSRLDLSTPGINVLKLVYNRATFSVPLTISSYGVGILKSSSAGVITSAAINLASADVTGILPVTNGGTGKNTITSGALQKGNGTGVLTDAIAGTDYVTPVGLSTTYLPYTGGTSDLNLNGRNITAVLSSGVGGMATFNYGTYNAAVRILDGSADYSNSGYTTFYSKNNRFTILTPSSFFGLGFGTSALTAHRTLDAPNTDGIISVMPIVNTTITTIQTSSSLNILYPNAVVGQQITTPGVGTGMKYEKINTTSGGTWIAWATSTI